MNIFAGVLLILSIVASFIGLFIDSSLAIVPHIIKLLLAAAGVVIVFMIGGPLWIKIVGITGTAIGFVGGVIACASDGEGNAVAFITIIGGMLCNLAAGIGCFF